MIIASIDTETTSKEESRSIVELGIVRWDTDCEDEAPSIIGIYEQRFKPKEPITFEAMGIHHITNGEVERCNPIEERVQEIIDFLSDTQILMGHNLPFDLWSLEREVLGGPYQGATVDTLRLARHAWDNLPNYKLSTLRYQLDLIEDSTRHENGLALPSELVDKPHSAAFDAFLCAPLAQRCRRELNISWDEVVGKAASPLKVKLMYFGKHKDMEIEDMVHSERGYVEWLLKQDWLEKEHPDLRWTILKLLR